MQSANAYYAVAGLVARYARQRTQKCNKNGTDAGSESRSKIYSDYAEQQGGKDREAGLKRRTSIPPSVASLLVTPISGGQRKTGNGELTYPLRSVAPRPPNLEGQRGLSVITNFLPLRQGESRRGGGMMKRNGENRK